MGTSARKRYTIRLAVAMAAFLVSFALAEYWIGRRQLDGVPAALLALLPGICVAGVFWALGRLLVEEQDEFRRVLLVREILIATGITLTVVTFWGFLSEYGIVAPGRGVYAVWLFFLAQGVGGIVNRFTYGEGSSC